MKKAKLSLFAIYLTYFVDMLSWAIVFPIFAPYFLDVNNVLFSTDVSQGTRTTILGIFLMAFSLGQFLGAPIIGEYADKYGRRKTLLVTVFCTLLGFIFSAWSMQMRHLILLFFARFVTGIFASSTTICLSCLSDLSSEESLKAKRFGYLSMVAGFAFLIGAYSGGKLSDQTISFHPYYPLWLAAFFTLVNFLFVLLGFQETATERKNVTFHFFRAFQNITIALRTKKIKRVYLIYFLFIFSWTILFQFLPVLTVKKFAFTNSDLGDLALFMGVCWIVGSWYVNKIAIRYISSRVILEWCLILFAVFCSIIIFPKSLFWVLTLTGICVLLGSLSWPHCTSLISNLANRDMQGKVLGISQSIQASSMAIAPLLGGLAIHFSLNTPFFIASIISLFAVMLYFTLKE